MRRDDEGSRFLAFAVALLAVALLVILIATSGEAQGHPVGAGEVHTADCSEDHPCWDCEIHGSGICGVVAADYVRGLDGSGWIQVWDGHNRLVHTSTGWGYYTVALDGSIWLQVWHEGHLLFEGLTAYPGAGA